MKFRKKYKVGDVVWANYNLPFGARARKVWGIYNVKILSDNGIIPEYPLICEVLGSYGGLNSWLFGKKLSFKESNILTLEKE